MSKEDHDELDSTKIRFIEEYSDVDRHHLECEIAVDNEVLDEMTKQGWSFDGEKYTKTSKMYFTNPKNVSITPSVNWFESDNNPNNKKGG